MDGPQVTDQRAERILVLAFGNPGRYDDGLGPAIAEALTGLNMPLVTVQADYQLQVEDAATIAEHDAVIFVDAAHCGAEPFAFRRVVARAPAQLSTHASDPASLLALAGQLYERQPPAYLLAVRGYAFDGFGEGLSARAQTNLGLAVRFLVEQLAPNPHHRLATLACRAQPAAAETEEP